MIGRITHTAHLPLGYVTEFRWTGGGMKVEWLPNVPVIRSPRHRRKFFEAYEAARRDFLTDVATTLGGNVGVVDIDKPAEINVVRPATKP
jgi:hypothetical protein